MVLAHRIETAFQAGKIASHADAAHALGVPWDRVAQIMSLMFLSPSIQEAILTAPPDRLDSLTTKQLEEIADTPDWEAQAALWARL